MHVLVHVCFNPESCNLWIKYTSLTVQYSLRVLVYPPTLTCYDIMFNSLYFLLLLRRFITAVWRVFMHNVSLVAISRHISLTGLTVRISVRFLFSSAVFPGPGFQSFVLLDQIRKMYKNVDNNYNRITTLQTCECV